MQVSGLRQDRIARQKKDTSQYKAVQNIEERRYKLKPLSFKKREPASSLISEKNTTKTKNGNNHKKPSSFKQIAGKFKHPISSPNLLSKTS